MSAHLISHSWCVMWDLCVNWKTTLIKKQYDALWWDDDHDHYHDEISLGKFLIADSLLYLFKRTVTADVVLMLQSALARWFQEQIL